MLGTLSHALGSLTCVKFYHIISSITCVRSSVTCVRSSITCIWSSITCDSACLVFAHLFLGLCRFPVLPFRTNLHGEIEPIVFLCTLNVHPQPQPATLLFVLCEASIANNEPLLAHRAFSSSTICVANCLFCSHYVCSCMHLVSVWPIRIKFGVSTWEGWEMAFKL